MNPALTPEEWASWEKRGTAFLSSVVEDAACSPDPDERHQAAALCMKGQKFGLTREHVKMLRDVAEGVSCLGRPWDIARHKDTTDLADLIESYLPPEEE